VPLFLKVLAHQVFGRLASVGSALHCDFIPVLLLDNFGSSVTSLLLQENAF
jgi:hypothetical protein